MRGKRAEEAREKRAGAIGGGATVGTREATGGRKPRSLQTGCRFRRDLGRESACESRAGGVAGAGCDGRNCRSWPQQRCLQTCERKASTRAARREVMGDSVQRHNNGRKGFAIAIPTARGRTMPEVRTECDPHAKLPVFRNTLPRSSDYRAVSKPAWRWSDPSVVSFPEGGGRGGEKQSRATSLPQTIVEAVRRRRIAASPRPADTTGKTALFANDRSASWATASRSASIFRRSGRSFNSSPGFVDGIRSIPRPCIRDPFRDETGKERPLSHVRSQTTDDSKETTSLRHRGGDSPADCAEPRAPKSQCTRLSTRADEHADEVAARLGPQSEAARCRDNPLLAR